MAVIKKTLFAKNLDKYTVLVNDTQSDSKYFKITELPDTFTGGKNAFLIAGSEYLVPDTKIQIELKDSAGNVIYHEPGEGMISSSINGETFVTEYYEGVSKVVAIYVYPDTAYGPCTLTILGELNEYQDANGLTLPVPLDWENKYNVKWQKEIDVNPSLVNTTKIRFYKRPAVSITELLEPIYRIDSGSKINSGISQSFADIKISNLETFAGDVKRVKVFRTSLGDISDYSLIQDILVESKELLTTFGLSGSVIGNTGTFTSETLKNYWNTGSLNTQLSNSRIDSGIKMTGGGKLTYTSSLDIRSTNTYELNLDAFYSSSTSSNLGIYLSYVSQSTTFTSTLATLVGTQPTKNLLDTLIPFKIDRDYPSASLYFSQSQGEWHLGNISLRLSQDTAFSPDEVSFITPMPTSIGNEDYNFKFEFYDVNNNYVPVFVTQSANFTGGNLNRVVKSLTFDSDRNAFRFATGSIGNPIFQQIAFTVGRTNLTGSVTYGRSVYDLTGSYIAPSVYTSAPGGPYPYPGEPTNPSENGFIAHIDEFTGSLANITIGSITYTASCEELHQHETIYRFEDGENAPGLFVTANTNQFIYKATDLSLNPTGQVITIEAKRKNLASADTPLTLNSGSGKPPLTYVSTNTTNGVDTYTISGTSYPYLTGETIYYISGSDQFGNEFSDAIKISPVKILDGFSIAASNENTSFPANSVGEVIGGFGASSGSITVKVGNEVISYASPIANNKFSASISATSGLTVNTFNGTDYSINALSQDSGSLTLLVKYQDGGGTIISSSKEITYSKVKKAAPVLSFIVGNNNQTATSLSTGAQIDEFVTASLSVIETYDGVSSTKTLTSAPTTTATNSYTIGNKTTTTIELPKITSGTDSVDISITGSVVDSENITRNVYGNISLAKTKKAAPVTLALLSSETQTILSSSAGYANPTTFTTSVTEGGSNYSYDASLATTNTYYVSSITGGTNSSGTITPTTPTTTTGTTVSLTISYKNSEGTTGTITKTHKVAVSLEGIQGVTGNDGKRTAANMVHYQLTSATAPPTPTSTSFTFATGVFTGLTANWSTGAPTYASGNTNKYWYASYTVVETSAGSGIGTPVFGAPVQAIGFSGLVSFTTANNVGDGTNTLSFGVDGATLINGSNISTGIIKSTNFDFGGSDTDASGSFMDAGTIFNLNNGSLRSKNFYINQTGDAVFKGNLSAAGGTFAGNLSAAAGTFTGALQGGTISIGTGDSIFKADTNGIYLGNATFASAPFRVSPAGALTATNASISGNITATSLTLSAGVTISNTQVSGLGAFATLDKILPNNVSTYIDGQSITTNQIAANSIVAGNIASLAFSGKNAVFDTGSIAGWNMDTTGLYKTVGAYTLRLSSNAQRISISQANVVDTIDRVRVDASLDIPIINVSDTGSLYWSAAGQNVGTIYDNSTPNYMEINTDFDTPDGSPTHPAVSGVYGIIGLVYAAEEIFVESEGFPNIDNTITGQSAFESNSEVSGYYNVTLRVRKFPTSNDALYETNADAEYGDKQALVAYREFRDNQFNSDRNLDKVEVYGATLPADGPGGIDTPAPGSPGNWYRVELRQLWQLQAYSPTPYGDAQIYARRPASDIFVKFGRVQNGYSVFSPGGLQVYQGVRNYMNVSLPSGSTGDAANFFIVKGKSQIIGSLDVTSGFSANSKQFKIQHPLNENKWLYHTSTESPRADLIYRGTLQLQSGAGSASIDSASNMTIGTFDVLTKNPQLFLQNNESFDRIKGYVQSGSVYVLSENQDSTASIDWSVIAERQDTEILKSPLYDRNGNYKTENYKGEYLDATRPERFSKFEEI